ncbi:MAG: terminase small subunit [Ruminococcus sp.]
MNDKQKRFAELYAANPNATEAAKGAGYSEHTARSQGQRLLTNADILQYIQSLQDAAASERIASLTETKAFWSDIMHDPKEKTADRLKASELLAKSSGAFASAVTVRSRNGDAALIATAAEEGGNDVIIYMPQIDSEENCSAEDD